jgi:hypothetical protein
MWGRYVDPLLRSSPHAYRTLHLVHLSAVHSVIFDLIASVDAGVDGLPHYFEAVYTRSVTLRYVVPIAVPFHLM